METRGAPSGLLEREDELAHLHAALEDAAEGRGRLVVVEGPAGIGKTALLERACENAGPRFLVLRARAGELEREFPHGVVRQLLEGHLRARPPGDRAVLLEGAAGLAAPAVSPESAEPEQRASSDPSFAVTHGLYWLTANLADERPLLLAVDDLQWSDVASLRFLVHLARRLEGLPVLVGTCVRTGEPGTPESLLSELIAEPGVEILRPAPLSRAAVAEILSARMGEAASEEFAAACLEATGGTPFLLQEIASALFDEGVRPTTDAVPRVGDVGPRAVGRAILRRLGRLAPSATELARAVAVLGIDARLHRAARLAALEEGETVGLADALVEMEILQPGRPLQFVHPVVRASVYEALPGAARAAAHGRAADLLAEEGADVDAVATHLLLAEPKASAETVERLREAAAHAMARGAAESARTYLRRALEEGGLTADQRARLLLERGRAQKLIDRPGAVDYLTDARCVAVDPVLRAEIAYDLADSHYYTGRWQEATELAESAISELGARDPELSLRIEALRSGQAFWDTRHLTGFLRRLPQLRELALVDSPAGRMIALMLGAATAWLGESPSEVSRYVDIGWRDGLFLAEGGAESWVAPSLWQALVLIDDLSRALETVEATLADARALGSTWGATMAVPHRAWIHQRSGDLRSAAADLPASLEAAHDEASGLWQVTQWYFVEVLLERPELGDEARRVQAQDIDPAMEDHVAWPIAHETRGRIRLANGDRARAIEDLTRCSQAMHAYGSPNGWAWRPALALALADTERDRALELAYAEVEAAQRVGLPRAIGIGLRTLGLVEGGEQGVARLAEAADVLEPSPARLEHARSLVALGAAHRRAGRRAAAREPLRRALDLAHRCGATHLQERARAELTATGARPRRAMLTGRDALTPSEQRIAGMAAEGLSNPEIAQALFVTRKNVENHLGRIYPKLDIKSRDQLPDALEREDEQ